MSCGESSKLGLIKQQISNIMNSCGGYLFLREKREGGRNASVTLLDSCFCLSNGVLSVIHMSLLCGQDLYRQSCEAAVELDDLSTCRVNCSHKSVACSSVLKNMTW